MPLANVNGISLYYEETGQGFPILFSHEFAGDHRSWEPQVRFFSRSYRCISYCHRGFPPSSVPDQPEAYSQDIIIEDLRELARFLNIQRGYFIGCSMGAQTVLMFACRYPELCRGLVAVGAGSGSTNREDWFSGIDATVNTLHSGGIQAFVATYGQGPTRQRYQAKDPRGFEEFRQHLLEHDATGQELTMLGVQKARPHLMSLGAELRQLRVPTLLVVGDEDEPCLEPGVFMKRTIPDAALMVFPQTGHTVNIEEPDTFNQALLRFLNAVEQTSAN